MEMKYSRELRAVLVGASVSVVAAIILAAVTTILVSGSIINVEKVPMLSVLINGVSAILGTSIAVRNADGKAILISGVTVAAYILILLLMNWGLFSGFNQVWMYSVLAIIAGGILSCFMYRPRRKKTKRYK